MNRTMCRFFFKFIKEYQIAKIIKNFAKLVEKVTTWYSVEKSYIRSELRQA